MPIRLLIVDDNEPARVLLTSIATEAGCDCVTAENGLVAIQILENDDVDGIFLDILMPEKDGIEVIRWLHKQGQMPPVVVFSRSRADTGVSFGDMAVKMGALESYDKPISKDLVVEAIEKIRNAIERR